MIFIWFLARSSRVTGPKMRVPIGSFCAFTSTAALPSKRISEPSGRRTPCAVRTTTAFSTSPFFTRPRGIASLTDTTMVSPTSAYLRREPPSTLMHMTRRAPELSATSSSVVIWIMVSGSRAALLRADASDHFPGLQLRERPAFADAHHVAHLEFPVLVMRVVLF